MKLLLKIIFGIVLTAPLHQAFGQHGKSYADSIVYWGKEKMEMLILTKDDHQLRQKDDLKTVLREFQDRLTEIRDQLPADSYVLNFSAGKNLDVLRSEKLKSFDVSSGQKATPKFSNQANVLENDLQVIFHFDDIEALVQADFADILSQIIQDLPVRHRFMRHLTYTPDPQTGKINLSQNRHTGYFDMLSLQGGVGASVYRNRLLTDITAEIGLQLNHKGILRNQFYLSNNLIFGFSSENAPLINNFTNFGYRRNLSHEKGNPNWLGVEIGTLTKRSGDIFQPNAMRLGVNWNTGKHITVSPQLYWNGFFRQVSPGFRIGIGL